MFTCSVSTSEVQQINTQHLFGVFASLAEAVGLVYERVTALVAPATVTPVAAPHALQHTVS